MKNNNIRISSNISWLIIKYNQVDQETVKTAGTDLEQAACTWRRARWRVDRIHPSELLSKVPHVKFTLQLWLKRTLYLLLC